MTKVATASRTIPRITINLLHLDNFHITRQLHLEEALMRNRLPHTSHHCWVITNRAQQMGHPCIIMGAGDARHPWELVHVDRCARDGIPLVKRFTGGGTVFVDHNSLFCSMIGPFDMLKSCANTMQVHGHGGSLPLFKPYPKDMLQWSSLFWKRLFETHFGIGDFVLQENDFAFGEKKFGGNAQYITGGRTQRWVQHTSFLWDFEQECMDRYLKLPEKVPEYRNKRAHGDFLCKLSERLHVRAQDSEKSEMARLPVNKDRFIDSIMQTVNELSQGNWKDAIADVREVTLEEVESFVPSNQTFGTYELDIEELMKNKSAAAMAGTIAKGLSDSL